MKDKEKIELLINYYLKEQDLSSIEGMEEWALRFLISNSIKSFMFPLIEDGLISIGE